MTGGGVPPQAREVQYFFLAVEKEHQKGNSHVEAPLKKHTLSSLFPRGSGEGASLLRNFHDWTEDGMFALD